MPLEKSMYLLPSTSVQRAALPFLERHREQPDLAGEAANVPRHAGMECVAFRTWQRIGNDAGDLLQVHGIS